MDNFKDVVRSAKMKGIILDSCGSDERLYDWGVYIDLCGMDVTEAMKVNSFCCCCECDTGDTPTKENAVYVSLQENGDEMEIVFIPTYRVEDNVVFTLTLDEDKFNIINSGSAISGGSGRYTVTIPYGADSKFLTGIKVTSKGEYSFDTLLKEDITVLVFENPKYIYTPISSLTGFVIEYYIDGQIFKTYHINFGDNVIVPTVDEKVGYVFSGWEVVTPETIKVIPEKMPNYDIVVEGSYIKVEKDKILYGVNLLGNVATYNGYINDGGEYSLSYINKDANDIDIDKTVLNDFSEEMETIVFNVPSNPDYAAMDAKWLDDEITDDEFFPEQFNNSYVFIIIIPEGIEYVIKEGNFNIPKTDEFDVIKTFIEDGKTYKVLSNYKNTTIPVSGIEDQEFSYKLEITE